MSVIKGEYSNLVENCGSQGLFLSSGAIIEVFDEGSISSIATRIEFNGITNQYYGTNYNLQIGQKVRLPGG